MNTQEVTYSHTLKVTQILHTGCTQSHTQTCTNRQTDIYRPTELQPHTQDHIGMGVVTQRGRHSHKASYNTVIMRQKVQSSV